MRALGLSLAFCLGAALVAAVPAACQDGEGWLSLDVVDVAIEVPAAFVSPTEPPILFADPRGARIARYPSGLEGVRLAVASVEADGRSPYDVAAALHDPVDAPLLTYEVDRADLGVVSGYDAELIFYSGCKRRSGRIACFSITYPERQRAVIDPTLGRILRSMR